MPNCISRGNQPVLQLIAVQQPLELINQVVNFPSFIVKRDSVIHRERVINVRRSLVKWMPGPRARRRTTMDPAGTPPLFFDGTGLERVRPFSAPLP